MTGHQENITAARNLTASMDALGSKVDDLHTRMGLSEKDRAGLHRTNRYILALVLIVLALAVLAVVQQVHVSHNAASVMALHSSQVDVCSASNARLSEQDALWDYLLAKSTIPKGTPAREKAKAEQELAHIRTLVHDAFAPRNCAALYSLKGKLWPSLT